MVGKRVPDIGITTRAQREGLQERLEKTKRQPNNVIERRKVIVTEVDEIHAMDLIQMIPNFTEADIGHMKVLQEKKKKAKNKKLLKKEQDALSKLEAIEKRLRENNGFRYILNVIDTFSRFAWSALVKTRNPEDVIDAYKKLKNHPNPKHLWVDEEFNTRPYQAFFNSVNTSTYNTFGVRKNSMVERFNRTMRDLMVAEAYKKNLITPQQNQRKYVPIYFRMVAPIVNDYNSNVHSSIKMTPKQARNIDDPTDLRNLNTMENTSAEARKKATLRVGDRVRIPGDIKTFGKSEQTTWSEKIHVITEVKETKPVTYKVAGVKGIFYEPQLLKSKF